MTLLITRFAPSPTGYLHLGHAFSAYCAFESAREAGGRFLLRIEDIDRARARAEFEQAIYDDLSWLGMHWSGDVRRQSEHFSDYARALDQLIAKGLVYRCFKTRRETAEAIASAPHFSVDGPLGAQYVGAPLPADEEAGKIAQGAAFAWRLSLNRARDALGGEFHRLFFAEEWGGPEGETGEIQARPEIFGDAVIARKDAPTSYHLACVQDDALQGVSHVVRGRDLFHVTHLHTLLQALLGLRRPIYRHHRLITDNQGKRLAKRDGAGAISAMRRSGAAAGDIIDQFEKA